ncbi:beta-lactamase superfamily domain-containing protein [Globomyces pollinis-pini]|nr:beta-lactamase superfamily domain-containing protein [Globomyces pollinis-pini]
MTFFYRIQMLSSKTIGVIVPLTVIAVISFEHLRYIITHPHRQRKLKSHWETEPSENTESDQLSLLETFGDYLLLPITYLIGFLIPNQSRNNTNWKQKFFHSLSVAGRYVNPFIEWQDRNTTDIFAYIKWQLTRNNRNGVPKLEIELERNLPLMTPNFELLTQKNLEFKQSSTSNSPQSESSLSSSWVKPPSESKITDSVLSASWIVEQSKSYMAVTWIGQSTCVVQMDGYNILTDPIFSSRTMGDYFGPKRLRPTPCTLEDLPPIDIVLISHNHYDHLDVNIIKKLKDTVTWYVPMGLKKWMFSYGVTNVVELDWWQEFKHDDKLTIIGTPIQHWSGRHFFDVNSTLWSSFVCKTDSVSFFHCGDTGYCSAFKEIGDRYGPITFAALPIGSYEPRYFMCHQHMNPEEACLVHQDIKATYSLGVHWGTFMMSDEHYMDPPKDFEIARVKLNLPSGSCFTSKLGETVLLDY